MTNLELAHDCGASPMESGRLGSGIFFTNGDFDNFAERIRADCRAALAATPDLQGVPAGFALVPIEPTTEMIAEGESVEDLYRRGTPQTWAKVYCAMITAAPRAPCGSESAECDPQAGLSLTDAPQATMGRAPIALPLSDGQVADLLQEKHFSKGYVLKHSDRTCLAWYRLGLRDGEDAHGINGEMKPS